ncbi:MAG: alpha/beta fold hydrolase [Gammaproteobacteria bacterium]|nr:alpha/beta fold hydrolase [Gammaproteobacteria bacterium]
MPTRILAVAALLIMSAANLTAAEPLILEDCRITAGPAYSSIEARCGVFRRPENPAEPDGNMLELRVAVVAALSLEPELDPFVPIAGGPGQASSDFYAATMGTFEKIRRNRDIVLLDQRGTGASARMDCDIDDDIVDGQMSLEETRLATLDCLDSLPHDPRFFTTSVAVTDLEALREALGYEQFNLYGISYGTRVAQHFARRYPASTRTVILDGVVPPQMALGPAIATEAQRALDAILARCAASEPCDQRFPNIAAKFVAVKSRLTAEAVTLTISHPVSGRPETVTFGKNELAGAIRLLSYHPITIALLPFLIDEAANDRFEPLAAQYLMIVDSLTDALSLGMHNAVVCTEDEPFFGGEGISEEDLSATYIGPLLVDALRTICSVWPRGILDEGFKTPLQTNLPVLLLSGDADPITPPGFAEIAAVDLTNATHLIGKQQGHGQAPRGCMGDVIADFIEMASVADLDTACLERMFAMPFFLHYSGPAP